MASTDVWSDFEVWIHAISTLITTNLLDHQTLRHNIRHNTVDKLKHIVTGLNDECGTILFKSGKKQDLIDRIIVQLDLWRNANNVERWVKAKAVLYLVRNSGM
jgi:E3 SUMO-protein ligase PIAS1